MLGASFDQITVTLSPDYFVVGKGCSSAALRADVAWLGFRSALPLGALVVGLGLLRRRSAASFSWLRWVTTIATVATCALITFPLLLRVADPFGLRTAAAGFLCAKQTESFLTVWGLHIGAYIGILTGTALAYRRSGRAGVERGG